jgi:hypothetical protein
VPLGLGINLRISVPEPIVTMLDLGNSLGHQKTGGINWLTWKPA